MSSISSGAAVPAARRIIYLGMDVHKESITIAVLPADAKTPTRLDRLPNDLIKLKRWLDRAAQQGELHTCYEASGAGYVIHRAMHEWGYACDVIAPSLIPKRPGVQRKHDKYDAAELARLYRSGELTSVRILSEAEERVRDVVRCRETFQREILKSRHYILKFLARRGFVYREGTNWCTPHLRWLQHLTTEQSPLAPADRLVFREYHALLLYKLQRRDDLDRKIERLAELPTLKPAVQALQCFPRDLAALGDGPRDGDHRLAPLHPAGPARELRRARHAGILERGSTATGVDHQSGEQSLPARARPSSVELSPSTGDERRSQTPAVRPTAGGDHARLEGATPAASALQPSELSQTAADRGRRRGPRARRLSLGGDAGGARHDLIPSGEPKACGPEALTRACATALWGQSLRMDPRA